MAAVQISESVLVNRGLGAAVLTGMSLEATSTQQPAAVDVLGSFKKFVTADVADVNLVNIVGAFTSSIELATYFINAKYAELGGAAGFLGGTQSAVAATANGAGFSRTFHNGVIYWHPAAGAHELHGPIRARWQELGAETSFLGLPVSDVTPGEDVRSEGFFAHFQGGSIYWAPPTQRFGSVVSAVNDLATIAVSSAATTPAGPMVTAPLTKAAIPKAKAKTARTLKLRSATLAEAKAVTSTLTGVRAEIGDITVIGLTPLVESSAGAFEVHGAIREKYLAMGAEASILGYPRTDETATPDGVGRFNHFQGGSIYWTPGTYAHEVHGLIRDRWASQGWERNPQLGYPIADEMIPDPRVGHRRPETRKKPIVALPIDVIKLPAEAVTGGFPATIVNVGATLTPEVAAPTTPVAAPTVRKVSTARAVSGALGKLSAKSAIAETAASSTVGRPVTRGGLNVDLTPIFGALQGGASTPGERSLNRFADFENGVLFWFRSATAATTLTPLSTTSDGTSLTFSGADIAAAALAKIGRGTFESNNAQLVATTFVGTTGYSFDGAQVHNRRHKLQLILQGVEVQQLSGPFGTSLSQSMPVTATVELQIEVWFDASQRQIALTPVDWALTHASSGNYGQMVSNTLRARLDPLLWTSFELMTLPDTNAGKPIAVLSVKTLPSGAVAVYIEPDHRFLDILVGQLDTAVTPIVLHAQPTP